MKIKVSAFAEKFRSIVGDGTVDVPDSFIINILNWALSDLPLNPKLDKVFTKNRTVQLRPGHYRWDLVDHKTFRTLTDVSSFNMFESTGGDPCKVKMCAVTPEELYSGGIPSLMASGKPCKYTIERQDDSLFLVFDRPIDVPMVIHYTGHGIPKTVESIDDTFEMPGIIENAVLEVMRVMWYREADDLAFAGAAYDYLDNKYIPQIIQMVNKNIKGIEGNVILGV
jgi:hypothetical protein